MPATFWNNRQKQYDEWLAMEQSRHALKKDLNWLKGIPVNEIANLSWIKKINDKASQLDEVLKFFGINSPKEWNNVWHVNQAVYRKSSSFKLKPQATSAWLRKGEIDARRIDCKPFNKKAFKEELKKMVFLSTQEPDKFAPVLIEKCAKTGVAVVFTKKLKGVPVSGATRWLRPDKALIQLSHRGKLEDIFWFTFFHEAGHILLHAKKLLLFRQIWQIKRLKKARTHHP